MRVGVGAQLLSYPRASRSGVGSYIRLLLEHLPAALGDRELHVFGGGDGERTEGSHDRSVTEHRAPFPLRRRAVRLPWEQLILPVAARRAGVDVFHHPDPLSTRIAPARRTVVTVHDLTAFRYPETFGNQRARYKQQVLARAVEQADRVIVDSAATGHDLVELLDVDPGRVSAVHLGVSASWRPAQQDEPELRRRYGLDGPYLLSVGTLEPRKNLARLIESFALARRRGVAAELVVVGPPGWKSGPLAAGPDRHGVADHVRFTGYLPAHELRWLYAHASAVVYPSLYEGFGLPVLEAMACGAPVIASSTPAVAEVAGDAALLVDPLDVDAIADAIDQVTDDESCRHRLSAAGLSRAASFTWAETARRTVAVYEMAAAS